MGTGFHGTFVISWSQTTIDGLNAAPLAFLNVGAAWSWAGDAVRVDGPSALLRLDGADGETDRRRRAARMVRRLVGAAVGNVDDPRTVEIDHPLEESCFVVTDGHRTYTVTLIDTGSGKAPLLMFLNDHPPKNRDLWVVHSALRQPASQQGAESAGAVICFTPGTRILTPDGVRPIEELREGDRVQTKDNGAQEIQWMGQRRMSGARLFAMPKLRPIRIRAGVFGLDEPDEELLVSPEHRLLVKGRIAQSLFNTSEVLVAARDIVDNRNVCVDLAAREVTYVHLMLPRHEILFANGVESESFHPAQAALSTLDRDDRRRLLDSLPQIGRDPASYGDMARRNLTGSEAAILLHEAA